MTNLNLIKNVLLAVAGSGTEQLIALEHWTRGRFIKFWCYKRETKLWLMLRRINLILRIFLGEWSKLRLTVPYFLVCLSNRS